MNQDLGDEDDQLLAVLVLWQATAFLNGVRHSHAQSDDEDDNEHDKTDEQVSSYLAPHAQNGPDNDGSEQDAERNVGHVGPVEAGGEQANSIAHDVVIDKRANERAMIDGQKYL